MSARRLFLLCMQIELTLSGAPDCATPAEAIARLEAYLSYQTGIGVGNPGIKKFSVTSYGGDTLFLQSELPRYSTEPLVYVFRNGRPLFVTSCPKDAEWATCAERRFHASTHQPAETARYPLTAVCDVSVTVEKWRPSPDTPAKRRIASDVLAELMKFRGTNPRAVYVRDFNLNDPELEFYIVDANGQREVQGCTFDAGRQPYCAWHLFGQSPVKKLKQEIMARPYRLCCQEKIARLSTQVRQAIP